MHRNALRRESGGARGGRTARLALLSPAVGTANIGDHIIELAIRRLLDPAAVYHRFSIRRPLTDEEIDQVNQDTSCALLCGTNLYQHDWESALTPEVLERIAVPVIPFGVGSSSARPEEIGIGQMTRRMIRALHARCTLGSVRDPHALRVVLAGGDVQNVVLTGCPVLFWAGAEQLPEPAPRPRRRLIVTARNWLMHRWPDNVDHPVQIELLRRVMSRFAGEGVSITFAVHEDFDRRLIDVLAIPPEAVVDSPDPKEYIRLYTDPDNVVLALRLHAGMLARANGLPVVFVGHDTRTYSFCEMTGIECIDLFEERAAERCIRRIEQALSGEAGAPDAAAEIFPSLRRSMREFLAANGLSAGAEMVARAGEGA